MIFKIGLLGESSIADIALEGPVPVVDISMCLEITCTAPPIIILVMFICYYAWQENYCCCTFSSIYWKWVLEMRLSSIFLVYLSRFSFSYTFYSIHHSVNVCSSNSNFTLITWSWKRLSAYDTFVWFILLITQRRDQQCGKMFCYATSVTRGLLWCESYDGSIGWTTQWIVYHKLDIRVAFRLHS